MLKIKLNSNKRLTVIIYRISKNHCINISIYSYILKKFVVSIIENNIRFFRKLLYITLYCIAFQSYFTFEANSRANDNITSYFFSKEQEDAILDNLNKMKNNHKIKTKQNKNKIEYKVGGICYLSPTNWTIWINGKSYNKIGQYKDFSIDAVSYDGATITTLDGKTIHLTVKCDEYYQNNKAETTDQNTKNDEHSLTANNQEQNINNKQEVQENNNEYINTNSKNNVQTENQNNTINKTQNVKKNRYY